MNTPIFRGVAAAVVTPTDEKGVDYVSFARLLNFLIDSGIDAIVVCGTTAKPRPYPRTSGGKQSPSLSGRCAHACR